MSESQYTSLPAYDEAAAASTTNTTAASRSSMDADIEQTPQQSKLLGSGGGGSNVNKIDFLPSIIVLVLGIILAYNQAFLGLPTIFFGILMMTPICAGYSLREVLQYAGEGRDCGPWVAMVLIVGIVVILDGVFAWNMNGCPTSTRHLPTAHNCSTTVV